MTDVWILNVEKGTNDAILTEIHKEKKMARKKINTQKFGKSIRIRGTFVELEHLDSFGTHS